MVSIILKFLIIFIISIICIFIFSKIYKKNSEESEDISNSVLDDITVSDSIYLVIGKKESISPVKFVGFTGKGGNSIVFKNIFEQQLTFIMDNDNQTKFRYLNNEIPYRITFIVKPEGKAIGVIQDIEQEKKDL